MRPLYCDWCGERVKRYIKMGLCGTICCGHEDCREGLSWEEEQNAILYNLAIETEKRAKGNE